MQENLIELKNVSRFFMLNDCDTIFDYLKFKNFKKKRKVTAVEDVSFEVKRGEYAALLGVNGAGKSTLIKMMTGILTPSKGNVTVLGNDPFKKRIINNRKIAAVFGQRCQLRWDIPPMESYLLFQAIYKIPDEKFKKNLSDLVSLLDAEKIIKQPVRTLSLGQKMRAELVGALLHEPEILFLDEPTLGLDVFSKQAVINFLSECKRKRKMTVILTTHDMDAVEAVCDRLMIVYEGKMLVDDKIEAFKQYTQLSTTVRLKAAKEDIVIPEELKSVKYDVCENEIVFKNISGGDVAKIISDMVAVNEIYEVDIRNPEFKDCFMDLLGGMGQGERYEGI